MRGAIGGGVRRWALAAVLVLAGALSVGAPAASAAGEPWWHVQQDAVPTDVSAAAQQAEVQEVKALEEETPLGRGSVFEATVNGAEVGLFATEPLAATLKEFGVNVSVLSRGALQAALETAYGAGEVAVGEAGGGEPGTVFVVRSTHAKSVAAIEVATLGFGGASARVTVAGRPAGEVVLRATDVGDGSIEGASVPVQVADVLPAGLEAVGIAGVVDGLFNEGRSSGPHGSVVCVLASLSCTLGEDEPVLNTLEVRVAVDVSDPGVGLGVDRVSVSGGGAPSVVRSQPVDVSEMSAPFGIEPGTFEVQPEAEGGVPDAQAGSHPFQLSTSFTFDSDGELGVVQPAQPRNVKVELPAGLVGNATLMPQCTLAEFNYERPGGVGGNACPASSAVGIVLLDLSLSETTVGQPIGAPFALPVFNLVPGAGEPARFGFFVSRVPVILNTSVRTGRDYGVTVTTNNATQVPLFASIDVIIWGDPNSPVHNGERGWECTNQNPGCQQSFEAPQTPFLTLPTSCEGQFRASMTANGWTEPAYVPSVPSSFAEQLTGCNQVPFSPSIEVAPDVQSSSSASGLAVDLRVPQTVSESGDALGEGTLRNITVKLPEGVALNPADAEGLESCSETQIGYEGAGEGGGLLFSGALPEPLEPGVSFCPNASKIGTVTIHTPLLAHAIEGAVYLATPAPSGETGMNPFDSLLAMYIVAHDPISGVLVKVPVKVEADPATGQLAAVSDDNPPLPFSQLELHFFGGATAPLSTPAHCGAYTSGAVFEPWSGGESTSTGSLFELVSGPSGGACPGQDLPFAPSLTAGTTSVQAGGFSPFTTTLSREDGNQDLQAVQIHLPPGLSGFLAGMKLCGEAQANAGTCPGESEIGETVVSVGVGGEPYTVTGGKVYITGPYEGAPFGLSIVNPANAGPFHLGNVVVRAKIEVDPRTAQLTVTTDNQGPYKIPQLIDGIPLEIRHVNVTVNRPGFTFNPTSCDKLGLTGTLDSSEGASANLAVPFQVTNCAALAFKPDFSVSTEAKTSRTEGATLHVHLTLPDTAMGTEANVARVKVSLPKALPTPLPTLQKACTEKAFAENPASCPEASRVGEARVSTPVLEGGLSGPAYFVSHGGAKYPELIMVLTGEDGVTVQVHGETFISKQGITSATFSTVPDVPFSSFELTLPKRKYPALTANGNLCTAKNLVMPTEITGQNGAPLTQNTKIAVTGCPKAKKAHKRKKRHAKKKR